MRKALLIFLCIVILIGVALGFFRQWGLRHFGPVYDPSSSRDVQKLLAIADKSRQLREALERFKHDHGSYPTVVTNLFPSYLQAAPTPASFYWAGWYYQQESANSYSMYYKVNWDDGLFYEHGVEGTYRWYYSVSGTKTDVTDKFVQK
jgi:hypothetical protein